MKEVWPDAFVEEGGLARNISVLRKALGEGHDDHRYIETIPRRGYRFVAPVRKISVRGSDLVVEKHTFARIVTEEELTTLGKARAALSTAKWSTRKRRGLVLLTVGLLVGLSLALLHFWPGGKSHAHLSYPLRLTNNLASDTFGVWSPDGSKIAFVSNRDGKAEIYLMDADGNNVGRLTNNSADDSTPAWSPDGSRIAFQTNRDGNEEIYVMNADGSNQKRLTWDPSTDSAPAWSPDGKKIAFASNRGNRNPYNFDIWVMAADGNNQTRITTDSEYDAEPAWSPDGKQIAFITGRDGNFEIYVMNADGSHQINLTQNQRADAGPSWSHDGSRIAFT